MDYSTKTRQELIVLCKEKGLKGYSGKKKDDILAMLSKYDEEQKQKQDTGKFRKNTKDQFYTKETVAKSCIQQILAVVPDASHCIWVEPSAGNGAFLHQIPSTIERMGLDIEPKAKDITKQDYLQWVPPPSTKKDILVVGNPPFGRQSSLAKSFIAKSCQFAKVIAFILPKSFTKPSMFNAFDLKFHLLYSKELEKDSFVLNGEKYDVPCVFQIWEKKTVDRPVEQKVDPVGFHYVKPTEHYDIAFRRVGGLAGKSFVNDGTAYSIQAHNFIKLDETFLPNAKTIVEKINKHTFPSNTVGPRSLSKSEANTVINEILRSVSLSS